MKFTILTLFPDAIEPYLDASILGRAQEARLLSVEIADLRDWSRDKHRTVDDAPYGGGGGMVLKAEPAAAALDDLAGPPGSKDRARVLFTSPRGRRWDQSMAKEIAASNRRILIFCGHYEGLDERIIETRVDEEVSLGDFVMTGGEVAALAIVDSVARLVPGVLGNDTSAPNDSFYDGLLEGPHYTRPEEFEGHRVPDILLSGNHAAIDAWRHEEALRVTRERRPDLYDAWYEAHREEIEEAERKKAKRRRRRSATTSGE